MHQLDLDQLSELLIRGAALQTALVQLGRTPSEILTDAARPETQALLASVRRVLTNNLTAALYRRAMEGSIPALTFWLRHNPDSPFYQSTPDPKADPFESMTDDELVAHAKSLGIDLEDGGEPTAIPNDDDAWPPNLELPGDFPE